MKIIESLKTISSYPIPQRTLHRVAVERGLQAEESISAETFKSKAYKLAEADLMEWLAKAPNVSEGGVSISLSQSERESLKRDAKAIYNEFGESTNDVKFGYIGDEL